jgi:type IV secretion system protein VirB11
MALDNAPREFLDESPAAPLLRWLLEPLDTWLSNPATEDVAINRPNEAWIRARGGWTRTPIPLGIEELEEIAILAGSLRKQDVGPLTPLCATELPGGERLQICLPPSVPHGTVSLTIRKPGSDVSPLADVRTRYQTAEWNRWRRSRASRDMGTLLALYDSGDLEAFLHASVRARLTILLCGATGSGKTTLSKSMLAAIDPSERIITLEDTLELGLSQPNVVRLLYSKDGLSNASIDPEALLQASLRMRPNRVLLQELRDDAAWTYIGEVVSGHPGSITTIHGQDAATAFKRLFALCKSSPRGRNFDDRTLIDLLSAAVDLIIPLHNSGPEYRIGAAWFAADAARRGEAAADLLRDL